MKNLFLIITLFFTLSGAQDVEQTGAPVAFEVGEWFKFRIHYMGVNAGIAELELSEAVRDNKKVFHFLKFISKM